MNKLLDALTESEFLLIRETELPAIADLDEDALLELHRRIRRARNKYVGLYRRRGAAEVSAKGGRGAARSANERNGAKAEIFEGALARVSKQLGVAAQRSARELKEERLARARQGSSSPLPPAKGPARCRASAAPAPIRLASRRAARSVRRGPSQPVREGRPSAITVDYLVNIRDWTVPANFGTIASRGRVSKESAVLGALYLMGVPVFAFLAWVFSEAVHVSDLADRPSRRLVSVLAGVLWPVVLVGVAQMLTVWILARLSQARRLERADRRLVSDSRRPTVAFGRSSH